MKNIVIISKVIVGVRPRAIGMERGLNIFKKSLSKKLKENLDKKLKEKNMDYRVEIDRTYESLEDLIKNGADLILISPFIKENIDVKNINKNNYYIMSEKEFLDGYIEAIVDYIEKLK